jgi:hypothetical protein
MKNKLEIREIEEFYSGPDWMKITVAGPTILFMLAVISAETLSSNIVAIVMGVSGGLLIFTSIFKLNAAWVKTINEYNVWLSNLPIEFVIKMRSSDEVSEESKNYIIRYLNTNHKGWSI